jgi:hypothetical protein
LIYLKPKNVFLNYTANGLYVFINNTFINQINKIIIEYGTRYKINVYHWLLSFTNVFLQFDTVLGDLKKEKSNSPIFHYYHIFAPHEFYYFNQSNKRVKPF